MQNSTIPAKFQIPFASGAGAGYTRAIPVTTADPLAADFTSGFKVAAFTPLAGGGAPPDGKDFNGILNLATSWVQRFQAGYFPAYNATFSGQIGGYPLGHVLRRANGNGFWRSTAENNTTNPDAGGAGWVLHGAATVFGRTGDVVAIAGDYTVDKITGAVADTDFTTGQLLATNGCQLFPGGYTRMWGFHTNTVDDEFVTFPTIPGRGTPGFVHNCLNVQATIYGSNPSSSVNAQVSAAVATGFMLHAQAQERTVFWSAEGF